ncbi:MAG: DUF5398 family protein [Chlamydiia bacterium]|nr:DUF5398 family protein [Chlamydiia bacterium]
MGNKKTAQKLAEQEFDLEQELKDPGKLRAAKEQIATRVQQLKNLLRQGGDKKSFEDAQTLLHGFLAAQKVIQRINRKSF